MRALRERPRVVIAAAAAALVAMLKPAIQDGGQRMVDFISGSG